MGGEQAALAGMGLAKACCGEARGDFAPADGKQLAYQREPLRPRRRVARLPIELGGFKGRGLERIGYLVAISVVSPFVFLLPSFADRISEIACEVAEERE